jgi:hypothetical protein
MIMIGRLRTLMALICWLAPALVLADTFPLDESYGNKDGCAYAKSGESTGSDNFFLLTKDAVTTAVSYCTFKKVGQTTGKGTPVTLSCEEEENLTDLEAVIAPADKDAMEIRLEDGNVWGPLKKCR